MCLGIPCMVVEMLPDRQWAIIETLGIRRRVGIHLVGEVDPGEFLMVHAGYAIEKLDLAEAEERIKIWEELLNSDGPR